MMNQDESETERRRKDRASMNTAARRRAAAAHSEMQRLQSLMSAWVAAWQAFEKDDVAEFERQSDRVARLVKGDL